MLDDIAKEVMNGQDDEAIRWLLDFSTNDETLRESIDTFQKYYFKCLLELRNKKLTQEELNNINKTEYIDQAINYLKKDYFKKIVTKENPSRECIQLLSEDEINKIINIPSNLSKKDQLTYLTKALNKSENEVLSIICKIIRLYNMQLKFNHTARITYIAATQVESLNIDSKIASKIIITSALMHDIGRFYQAANYNTLNDNIIRKEEQEISVNNSDINLKVDHAIAGYYYSLMDLYVLNALNKATYQELITHAIAAIIVRFHQLPNNKLQEFQSQVNDFHFDENLEVDTISFIVDSFKDAPLLKSQHSKFNFSNNHLTFIDRVINEIITTKKEEIIAKYKSSSLFFEPDEEDTQRFIEKIETVFDSNKELKDKLEEELIKYYEDKGENQDLLNRIINAIKNVINKNANFEVVSETEIEPIIQKLANYDIAYSVQNNLKSHKPINPEVKKLLSLALNLTMDADKIDILNQRAIGIYNTSYNPSSYSIYPKNNMTLIELLNTYFAFSLDKNNLIINRNIIEIIEDNITEEINNWFIKQGINLNKLKVEDQINISANHPLYQFIAIIPWKNIIKNDNRTKKEYLKNKEEVPTLKVPTRILNENLQSKSDEEKVNIYKKLIITDEQSDKFKTEDFYPIGVSHLEDVYHNKDQEHILWNPIMGLIWQINQFIFVNMRSRGSYEFIKSSHILENIYKEYQENPILAEVIRPYIAYALLFIDTIMNIKSNGNSLSLENLEGYNEVILYDNKFMTDIKLFVKKRVDNEPYLLEEYEQKLINYQNTYTIHNK